MNFQQFKQAMHQTHSSHAKWSIVLTQMNAYVKGIKEFLITALVFPPSLPKYAKGCPPASSLTMLALGERLFQKDTKSRIAFMRFGFFLSFTTFFVNPANADELTIGVASNFLTTAKALAEPFKKQTGHTLVLISASSGSLASQIIYGSPVDVFLSADQVMPRKLAFMKFGDPHTLTVYAIGRLVLYSPTCKKADGNTAVEILTGNMFKRFVIANPTTAPYGTAAVQTLKSLSIYKRLEPNIILGGNIAQTFSILKTGAADFGLVALSQMPEKPTPCHWTIPQKLHKPIVQSAVITKKAKDNKAAHQFLSFLTSKPAKAIIRFHGYSVTD